MPMGGMGGGGQDIHIPSADFILLFHYHYQQQNQHIFPSSYLSLKSGPHQKANISSDCLPSSNILKFD